MLKIEFVFFSSSLCLILLIFFLSSSSRATSFSIRARSSFSSFDSAVSFGIWVLALKAVTGADVERKERLDIVREYVGDLKLIPCKIVFLVPYNFLRVESSADSEISIVVSVENFQLIL